MQALNPGATAVRGRKYIDTIIGFTVPRLYKQLINSNYQQPTSVSLGADQNVCTGTNVTLSPVVFAIAPYTYQWASTGNTLSCSNCANPNITVTQATTVRVTVTDAGNVSVTDTVTLTPISCSGIVSVSLGSNQTVCPGTAVALNPVISGGQSPYTYAWNSTGNALNCNNCAGPTATITQQSVYTVTVTDANSHSGTATITYNVTGGNFQISANGSTTLCQGNTVTLNAGSGYTSYNWSNGGQTQSITVGIAGTYVVTVTTNNNCTLTASKAVTVNNPTISNYQIVPNGPTALCGGGNVTLNAGNGFLNYQWNTGSTQPSITVNIGGSYSVTVLGTDGCTYIDTQSVSTNGFSGQQICIVSVDQATGKNIVVWEKTSGLGIDSFKIYKETTVSGQYQLIRQQAFGSFSTYTDNASNPQQQSNRYVITTVDACGESPYSNPHKTIHLTSNTGINNEVNLIWTAYQGFNYGFYNIYRGSSSQNMQQLTQVNSGNLSYTDLTPPAPPLYYQIEAVNPQGCVPTQKTDDYSSTLSNVVQITPSSVGNISLTDVVLYSYYNTANGSNMLAWSNLPGKPDEIKLYDLTGKLVLNLQDVTSNEIALPAELPSAFYVAELKAQGSSTHRKIHLQ